MIPRLVATDLDGTLVRSDGTISDRTVDALSRVDSVGVPVVIVTGRPPRWLGAVAERLGRRGVAVCANGAIEYDLHTERIVDRHLIDPDALAEVVAALDAAVEGLSYGVEYGETWAHEVAYNRRWRREDTGADVVSRSELLDRPATKLLAWSSSELSSDEFLARASPAVGERAIVTHSSARGLLEISAAGVTKASGLALVAGRHGVDSADVVAFGDMPNDVPMLAWAGRSYAVANAHQAARGAATEVVASNDDDGVARTLARWF